MTFAGLAAKWVYQKPAETLAIQSGVSNRGTMTWIFLLLTLSIRKISCMQNNSLTGCRSAKDSYKT